MPRWEEGREPKTMCQCGRKKATQSPHCWECRRLSPARPLLGLSGPNHPAWKGGTSTDRDGYARTYAPNHPWPRSQGFVREHIRLVELQIGRRIDPKFEVVHHKDGNRANNDPSNLELLLRSEHSKHHSGSEALRRPRDAGGRFCR